MAEREEKKDVIAADRIIEAIPDSVIVLDFDGKVTVVNPAYTRMFGWKPEDRIGKSFTEFKSLKAEEIERFMNLLSKLIETGYVEPLETVIGTKDGRELPISVAYSLIKDAEGNPKNIIAVLRDITELKRAEEKLKESEEHYRIFASYQHAISELRKFYMVDATFEQMVQKTLDLIVEEFGYCMVWYAELIEKEKVIIPKLWAGKTEKYLDGLRLEFESDKRDAKCAMSLAILTKKPFGYADLKHDKDFEKWRAFALQYGYRSNQAIPFIVDGKCKSAFLIYSTCPFAFSEKLVEYLKGIIDELATIIENITELKHAEEKRVKAVSAVAAEKSRAKEAEKFTKELQEKVNELEEFHDLAVGRELKMVELKKEIEELKKKV